jgi:N-acetyl-anhydromuramyl-L-alanine amidase AmpD
MPLTTIGCAAGNFRLGRPAGLTPAAIVLHRSGGREALRARFNTPGAAISAHYVVGRDGSIDRCVDETDTAYHAGLVVNPAWRLSRPNVNPNFYTIGLELAGEEVDDWPDEQISSASVLVADIARRWELPIDADHVIPHRAIRASSHCPPATCPVDTIIERAQRLHSGQEVAEPTTDAMDLGREGSPAPGATDVDGVNIDRTTLVLPAKEYYSNVTQKDLIVLHFTAGTSARSAFETWRRDPQHVATAYIVDLDGTIYEVFPPTAWAAHLGVKGTNYAHDRRSIGIEIANVGPLQVSTEEPGALNWWPRKSKNHPEFTTRFCGLDESDRYVATEFRGKKHFAAFPARQVDAVAALVRGLCDRFHIPMTLPAQSRRYTCDVSSFANYKGVCTHANFRQDKWDIGPAFPWDRLGL